MTDTISTPLRRTAATLAGLALATAGLTVAGATTDGAHASVDRLARPANVNVSIALQTRGPGKEKVGGKVASRKPVCKRARSVQLLFRAPGTKAFSVVRTDKSAANGVWVVPAPGARIPTGKYYAKIAKKGTTCQAARSRTITVR